MSGWCFNRTRSTCRTLELAALPVCILVVVLVSAHLFITKGVFLAMADESGQKPMSATELKEKLSEMQYYVTQQCGTEPPFKNEYWNNHREGIYVDVVSGEALFSSRDKFDSGTGWPSFTQPLAKRAVVEKRDSSHGMERVEVRSAQGDSHLGHVFTDGPGPTGLRYCINSAALRFIPVAELEGAGYGEYSALFGATPTPSRSASAVSHGEEVAILAGGCFWGVEELIRVLPGVVSTDVGYIGGSLVAPTYRAVSTGATGHAEAVRVVFDPAKLSYADLLRYFYRLHDPTTLDQQGNDRGSQYRSAIFFISEEQRRIAEEITREVNTSGRWKGRVVTQITQASEWYSAESYHQDYLQKHPDGYTCHYLRD